MKSVPCPHCSEKFAFDPAKIWTSPGQFTKLCKANSPHVVIQCPKCQHWITVQLPNGNCNQPAQT
jgi:DNA-directed RNA polymerase subunit RPC12/RpoP